MDAHAQAVAQAPDRAGAAGRQRVGAVVVVVGVGGHRAGWDESLGWEFETLAEEAEFLDPGDDGVHFLPDAAREQRQQFDFVEFPLGLIGCPFRLRAMAAQHHEVVGVGAGG